MNIDKTRKKNVDPVCGMTVDRKTKVKAVDFDGHTYFFCADSCRMAFQNQPQKYLVSIGKAKRKGVWQRYLDRLNRATGGQPPSCH